MNAVDRFLLSYMVPEISTFKEPKHDTQNWLTANNNNSQNCDVIRFARLSVSYKIDYNSASTHSNPLKLCEQTVARKIRSLLIEFWLSKQHSRFQAPLNQNNDSSILLLWLKKSHF